MWTRLWPAAAAAWMVSWGGSGRWSRLAVHRVDSLLDQRVRDMARRSVGDRSVGKSASIFCVLFTSPSSSTSSLGVRLHATETHSARFVNVVWLLELRKPIKAKLATD